MLAWDASTDTGVAGYVVVYGTRSGVYSYQVDVGAATSWSLPPLAPSTTYYFAVRAYNAQRVSGPVSTEVSYCTPPRTDLLWQHTTGAIARWQLDGTRQITGESIGPGTIDTHWQMVGGGDFDADGMTDVVWRHSDGRIAVWLMSGALLRDGRLFQPDRVTDTNWRIAAVADIDGDGLSDLIWQHRTSGALAVWLMSGTVLRDGHALNPGSVADPAWSIVGAGDFNGDGHPDLLWRHTVNGSLAVWYMNGSSMVRGELLTPSQVADLQWRVAGVSDVTGDGLADILWEHADGRLSVWIMNGSVLVSGGPLTPGSISDPAWRLAGSR